MQIRRRLLGLSLAAALALLPAVAVAPTAAVLSECDLTTEVCATLTVVMGDLGSGNFKTYADQFHLTSVGVNCSQFIATVQGTCAYRYTLYDIGTTPKTRTLYWSSVADSKSLTCVEGCGSHLASLSGSITLSANQSAVIHAYFEPKDPKELGVAKNGSGSGTVIAQYPGGLNCGATCFWQYDSSYTVELVATPDADATFDGWSGACSGTAHCVTAMSTNRLVTATFTRIATPPPETVPPTPKPSATVQPSPKPSATALATPLPTASAQRTPAPTGAPRKTPAPGQPGTTPGPGAAGPPSPTPPPGPTAAPDPTVEPTLAALETAGAVDPGDGALPSLVPIETPGAVVQPAGNSNTTLVLVPLLIVLAGGALFFLRRPH